MNNGVDIYNGSPLSNQSCLAQKVGRDAHEKGFQA
jgi:hypothetical protein